jgi:hypothetical protein
MRITDTLIIGAGGTGGILIPPLVRLLTYHDKVEKHCGAPFVAIADGDDFEEHNRTRQVMPAIATGKVEAMTNLLDFQALPTDYIDPLPQYLDEDFIKRWLRSGPKESSLDFTPLIVVAVDNDATRKATLDAIEAVHEGDFFWVSPGNATSTATEEPIRGQVLWYGRYKDQQLGLNPALLYPNIERPDGPIPQAGSCSAMAPSEPQLLASNALAAAWTLAVISNLLDGQLLADQHALFFDGRKGSANSG